MSIRGIYHCSPNYYNLASTLRFSHVQILNPDINYPDYKIMKDRVKQAHDCGLSCLIDPHLFIDLYGGLDFLDEVEYKAGDLIYLVDEPNARGIDVSVVIEADNAVKEFIQNKKYEWKTFFTLSPKDSFKGYEHIADLLGISYYRGFLEGIYRWSLPKLLWKIWTLNRPRESMVGIGAVKFNPKHLEHQIKFWESLRIKNMFWYSWTPHHEKPKWLDSGLEGLEDFQDKFWEFNFK